MKRKYGKDHLEWRRKLLERDDNQCVVCGNGPKYLNVHHIIPKNFKKWEFAIDNGICLCAGCHTLSKFSAHKNPFWFYLWMKEHRPKQLRIALERLEIYE